MKGLKCRECGREYPLIKIYACEHCFAPLEIVYDLDSIKLNKGSFRNRARTVWRYHELLPIYDKTNIVDLGAGYTILHKCHRLADALGIKNLYMKDDTVNPTNSFKDRPATVAVSKAQEFGAKAVGCASTGNLAAAVAAHAAKAGLPCYVFIPADTEANKVLQAATYGAKILSVNGTYDETNRLAAQASEEYGWAFANINIRPYYVEGSKTLAFEVCEQLGWSTPDSIVVPTGSGALLCAIWRAFNQFNELGLIDNKRIKVTAAQPHGCSPIVSAFKSNSSDVEPIEKPNTIAKSLAIGDPGDGLYTLRAIRESGGVAESATDEEILEAIQLLAKTEGIFAEPAGGVAIAVLKKLIDLGEIAPDEKIVCCITGSGFKASESILGSVSRPLEIEPTLESLSKVIN
ncbi:threonine synthase [Candidatus Bathyarchaeota archaeon]|nr:threonine synthase [Candidatus Bathyarchaeota archaeon]